MNWKQLAGKITGRIDGCSVAEIVRAAAGGGGLAIFPQCGVVLYDRNFTEGRWTDGAVQQYWTQQYGRGALVKLCTITDIDFEELISQPGDDEGYTQLDVKLRDPDWVHMAAEKVRAAMYLEIEHTAQVAFDDWSRILDDAAQEVSE